MANPEYSFYDDLDEQKIADAIADIEARTASLEAELAEEQAQENDEQGGDEVIRWPSFQIKED